MALTPNGYLTPSAELASSIQRPKQSCVAHHLHQLRSPHQLRPRHRPPLLLLRGSLRSSAAFFNALQHSSGLTIFAFGGAFTSSIAYFRKRISAFLHGINRFSLEAENLSFQWERTKLKGQPKNIDPKH